MGDTWVPMPIHPEPELAYEIYTVAMILVTGAMFTWWVMSAERRRDKALPLLLAGGAASGLLEPFLDNIVLFWYPPEQHLPSFQAFSRTVPIFVPIGYAWFCGGLLYFTAQIFRRGVSQAQVWAMAAALLLIDFIAIGATSWLDVAGFYGDPPFEVLGYPLWWFSFDLVIVIGGGLVVHYLSAAHRQWNQLYLLAVPFFVVGAATGAVGGPISIALNSGWSIGAKSLAALVTIGLGMLIVHAVAQIVATDTRSSDQAPRSDEVRV